MGTRTSRKTVASIIAACAMLAFLGQPAPVHAITTSFLYDLSDFTGSLRYGGASVFVDKERNEAYVLSENIIQVFNDNGMEIYRFRASDTVGTVVALAVDRDGTIYALVYKQGMYNSDFEIVCCNFRGEAVSRIAISGVPADFTAFRPVHMEFQDGQFYLADSTSLRVVVADRNGQVRKSYDLLPVLELKESDRGDVQMGGFSVDASGNMLFTVPVLFTAYVLYPDGKHASFGQPGSLPGKFSIASDIIRDNRGNILVADKLKSVVNIYDQNFTFLMEFGGRGNTPGSIVVPGGLALDSKDRLYVTQASNRGVSVFRLMYH